jgi:hypothetical protein
MALALWPTPTVDDSSNVTRASGQFQSLTREVMMWPTPNVPNGGRRVPKDATIKGFSTPTAYRPNGKKVQVGLEQAVEWWPTPTASMVTTADMEQARFSGNGGKRPDYATFATPKSRDWKGQSQRGIHAPGDALPNMDRGDGNPVGGSLNPTWVEWLMGWPLGWTDCSAPATAKYQAWFDSHGRR